ncbi:cell division topological specificity factor [Musa troglodytarum]|uniref:Cell division topological specificity factor n=1 Tax=Musa troglodytarum TaxID=320322 RepID=A0A9E7F8U6_9LILI|nr:cell division topological specificity factor [Musa troglodytarum]
MAISGDLKVLVGACTPHPNYRPLKSIVPSSKVGRSLSLSLSNLSPMEVLKVHFGHFLNRASDLKIAQKWLHMESLATNTANHSQVCPGLGRNNLSPMINQDAEGILLNVVNMSFFDRLGLAWKLLFPTMKARRNTNARIAKQRLKMILFSDRCAISDEEAKDCGQYNQALSKFVEIDSQDKVQLNVSTDTDLGTVYSRVLPEHQDSEEDYIGKISSIEFKDTGETSGIVDVKGNMC